MAAEYSTTNTPQRRYVFEPRTGQPVILVRGHRATNQRYLSQDERGSVISASGSSGAERMRHQGNSNRCG